MAICNEGSVPQLHGSQPRQRRRAVRSYPGSQGRGRARVPGQRGGDRSHPWAHVVRVVIAHDKGVRAIVRANVKKRSYRRRILAMPLALGFLPSVSTPDERTDHAYPIGGSFCLRGNVTPPPSRATLKCEPAARRWRVIALRTTKYEHSTEGLSREFVWNHLNYENQVKARRFHPCVGHRQIPRSSGGIGVHHKVERRPGFGNALRVRVAENMPPSRVVASSRVRSSVRLSNAT